MTEEQRRQAAAQRCADLANEFSSAVWEPKDFTASVGIQASLFNTILQLDELARLIQVHVPKVSYLQEMVRADAAKHILPEPKLTPYERLAAAMDSEGLAQRAVDVETLLMKAGLELREKNS